MDDTNNTSNPSDAKQQLVDKLNSSSNILVTVSRNPSVDQLASCIGLTLLLNKQGKHAAAVFSGIVPSTLEFLQPEETLEKNTDSLRDFIIALDKSKADKLRYKVEDNVVRIFITPYKTSISEADLEFTQGDFNVDVVVALGVQLQEDLDEAITAHGRILHDATLASISTSPEQGLGTINWHDPQASSLSELVTHLAQALSGGGIGGAGNGSRGGNGSGNGAGNATGSGAGANNTALLDNQIATALLTGIVAETDRFSNDKTNSQTMSASALLMAAGANQQLIATKLEEAAEIPLSVQNRNGASGQAGQTGQTDASGSAVSTASDAANGVMQIDHEAPPAEPIEADQTPTPAMPGFNAGDQTASQPGDPLGYTGSGSYAGSGSGVSPGARMITEPPTLGGVLTANTRQEMLDPSTDPLGTPGAQPLEFVDRTADSWLAAPPAANPNSNTSSNPASDSVATHSNTTVSFGSSNSSSSPSAPLSSSYAPPPAAWIPPAPATRPSAMPDSLAALEASVRSPHLVQDNPAQDNPANLNAARDEVSRALNSTSAAAPIHPEALQALNAQPLGAALHDAGSAPAPTASAVTTTPLQSAAATPLAATNPTPSSASVAATLPPAAAAMPPPAAQPTLPAQLVQPTQPLPPAASPQLPADFSTNPGPMLNDILNPSAVASSMASPTAPTSRAQATNPQPTTPQAPDPTAPTDSTVPAPPPVPPPIPFQFGSPPAQ